MSGSEHFEIIKCNINLNNEKKCLHAMERHITKQKSQLTV